MFSTVKNIILWAAETSAHRTRHTFIPVGHKCGNAGKALDLVKIYYFLIMWAIFYHIVLLLKFRFRRWFKKSAWVDHILQHSAIQGKQSFNTITWYILRTQRKGRKRLWNLIKLMSYSSYVNFPDCYNQYYYQYFKHYAVSVCFSLFRGIPWFISQIQNPTLMKFN